MIAIAIAIAMFLLFRIIYSRYPRSLIRKERKEKEKGREVDKERKDGAPGKSGNKLCEAKGYPGRGGASS